MKILLIRVGAATLSHYNITYPMGILYLAGAIRRALEANVKIIDGRFPWNHIFSLCFEAKRFQPDVIGLSALTQDARMMHALASRLKKVVPRAFIVVGGAHATIFPKEILADGSIDIVIAGEGEHAFTELLRELASGKTPSQLPGLWTHNHSPSQQRTDAIQNIDLLPEPAWDLLDERPYTYWPTMAPVGIRRYRSLVTSRGCPYGCIYCHHNHGKKFRAHSAERVLEEIARAKKEHCVKDIEILDDVFNMDTERASQIMEGAYRQNMKVSFLFPNGLRSDRLPDPLLRLMRQAGTTWISFAIETASSRLQELLGKRLRIPDASHAIQIASDLGIFCDGFFMLGLPTETESEAEETIRFAITSPLHSAKFFLTVPFPETELYKRYHTGPQTTHYSAYDYFYCSDNVSLIPSEKLHPLITEALRRFYFTPHRFKRALLAHPRPWTLPFFAGVVVARIFLLQRILFYNYHQ